MAVSMLAAVELAEMRTTATSALPDTATIYLPLVEPDGAGGTVDTWLPTSDPIPARLSPVASTATGQERVIAARVGATAGWIITLPALTVINRAERIEMLGRTFEVLDVTTTRSWEVSCRVLCSEVT